MTPFKGCRATHHGQIPGPPMGQAPSTAQHTGARTLSREAFPPSKRGEEPARKGRPGLEPRRTPGSLLQHPAHVTPSCPKAPSCHLGPQGLAPCLAQSRTHRKWVWGPQHGPLKNGVGRLCPGKQLALQK